MNKQTDTYVAMVAFVGLPNVGKSTLLNALIGTKIAPTTRKPQTTRRIIRGIKTVGKYQQVYFDTPGILRKKTKLDQFMHEQIMSALADVDQVVAIVDAKDPAKKHADFLRGIKNVADNNKQKFILAINKIDKLQDKTILLNLISEYSDQLNVDDIVPISAIKGGGLKTLFEVINKEARQGEFLFSDELFTDASEKEIVAEIIREKAMLELKDELPYKVAVSIDNFDESRRENEKKPIISIDAIIHVERPSQKAIVIGKGGASIRAIGTRARNELEHLLDCQVMLKLFVRVEPNWTSSLKSLRKLGY